MKKLPFRLNPKYHAVHGVLALLVVVTAVIGLHNTNQAIEGKAAGSAEPIVYSSPTVTSTVPPPKANTPTPAVTPTVKDSTPSKKVPAVTIPTPFSTPAPVPASAATLFARPDNPAARQATAWANDRPADAALMSRLASVPTAQWYGDWTPNPSAVINTYVSEAQQSGALPILVAYNIPDRDCGSYSAGGSSSESAYATWIQSFANGIGKRPAIVILEPDAIAGMDCLSEAKQSTRLSMISDAVQRLRTTTNASVYIDAGHARWHSAQTMANRLKQANVASATGFALNVSNFFSNSENISYGNSVSKLINGKTYVIDTSRNGNGSNGEWCNPSGRAVGTASTLNTGQKLVDAFIWIKQVGESDGSCNGGPGAGVWWAEYAVLIARNAGY